MALVLSGSIFGVTISSIILDKTREDMLYTLRIVDHSLNYEGDLQDQVGHYKNIQGNKSSRFTIMDFKGNVHADSDVDDYWSMENHGDRKEFKEALEEGVGYGRRTSDTLKLSMLYVAILSNNGEYILRMAHPFSGILEYTGLLLPAILISIGITLAISALIARQFSRSMTKPLNEITEEMLKLNDENPEFHFDQYQYDEMNVIAQTVLQMANSVKESRNRIEFEKMIRQEFFSNASHELKTPITSIQGYIELLENGLFTDEKMKKDFYSRIKKETSNMTNLINDILMISRLETKEIEVTLTDVRICPLLKEVCTSLEPLAKDCKVTIELSCKPIVMHANAQQLRELISNLITNAIKYNKPNGKVKVTVTSEAKELVLTVEDTGVGIPEDAKQRVFERFYRVDKGRSKKMGGTGLGLSIVKHIVNYYNGSIELLSKVNEGSKFIIRLPIQ
nr:ATP-binding protein [Mobilitalea sibirica]